MNTREMPVFVRIDEYKEALDVLELIKNKLASARSVLSKINDLKNEEDAELEGWNARLSEIEHKVEQIDHTLLEPQEI